MDYTKYNLRCNRSISEKMTKKDFIYDMRPPQMMLQKYTETRPPILTSFHVPEKHKLGRQLCQSNIEINANNLVGSNDAFQSFEPRILSFECNFCNEPIATLSSLSTHVKSHWKKYCKKCYWILEGDETIEQHNYYIHRILSNTPISFNKTISSFN